jgi:hypothetical protein
VTGYGRLQVAFFEGQLLKYGNPTAQDSARGEIFMAKNIVVFGIYSGQEDAANAVHRLRVAGFRSTDVAILVSENSGNKDLGLDKATKAPEGAVAGAGSGAILGGALGWLAAVGTLAIPGAGPFLAAGPLLSLLAGVGAGGAVGGVAGALIGAGTPEYEAKRYEGRVHKGHVLLSVHCDNAAWSASAQEILKKSGAEDISETSESSGDFDTSDRPTLRREVASSYQDDFRKNFVSFYAGSGLAYEELAPAYEWGFNMANDPRYRGKNFPDVEPELKAAYLTENPNVDWEKRSTAVLYGWEKAGGIVSGFALI